MPRVVAAVHRAAAYDLPVSVYQVTCRESDCPFESLGSRTMKEIAEYLEQALQHLPKPKREISEQEVGNTRRRRATR